MEVTIGGVTYVPEGSAGGPSIGIAITTRNRPEVLAKTLKQFEQFMPRGAKLVVVDDASTQPTPDATFRFEKQAGIARAKNKCLELLNDCDHIFLFDDDCYPIADDWWQPYIDSPEPHLMYQFEDLSTQHKLRDMKVIYEDTQHIAYTGARGCMVYVERRVLDVVGGLDPVFGVWGWEHPSWADRIHMAGLSSWRYADVAGSEKLIYSLDEHQQVASTDVERRTQTHRARNRQLHIDRMYTSDYVEYRETRNIVASSLLTSKKDPQRNNTMSSKPSMTEKWRKSLSGHDVVLFHDFDCADLPGVTLERVDSSLQPYFARWEHLRQYLRAHPEVHKVWHTDCTDVELLKPNLFDIVSPGMLYVGSEPTITASTWMVANHKTELFDPLWERHGSKQLLNAGLVGGERAVVLEFLNHMLRTYYDTEASKFHGQSKGVGMADMATFNLVCREHFSDRLVYGPQINTEFKREERNEWALWKHK